MRTRAAVLLGVAFAHDIRLIASALGPPLADVVTRAHANEVVAALAGTRQHAVQHAAAGVDLVVAQGTEASGHTGELSTTVVDPEVVEAVSPTAVLAAGGIARGCQVAATLASGPEGVWCGSVWLTTEEAEMPSVVKDKFLAASSSDTVPSLIGKLARTVRTAWTDECDRHDAPEPLGMPLQSALIGDPQLCIHQAASNADSRAASWRPLSGRSWLAAKGAAGALGVLDMVDEFIDEVQRLGKLVQR
ncbi:nitronate monooxygenase family protein [Mycobacterium xenopi 3993]|nr:nitronate monooxygenase family protein [Mycobacterium xenopi 3993]